MTLISIKQTTVGSKVDIQHAYYSTVQRVDIWADRKIFDITKNRVNEYAESHVKANSDFEGAGEEWIGLTMLQFNHV